MKSAGSLGITADSSKLLVLCICAALLGGCATGASHEGMVPPTVTAVKKHPHTVAVDVTGGQETDAMGKPQISNEAFAQALEQAISQSQVFSRVVKGGSGQNYRLSVVLVGLDQPSFGFSFTVKMEAGWTLKRADNGATVWQESVRSEYTAGAGDAFAGVVRLRMATEGAAKDNISQGLAKISQLNL
jgi:hypothetical protein